MSYKILHEEKKMTKGNLNNENLVMPKPFSILGYNLVYYYFWAIGSMKSYYMDIL